MLALPKYRWPVRRDRRWCLIKVTVRSNDVLVVLHGIPVLKSRMGRTGFSISRYLKVAIPMEEALDKPPERLTVSRREFLTTTAGLVAGASTYDRAPLRSADQEQPNGSVISLPEPTRQKRPAWWRNEGLAMVNDDWEPLLPRLRAGKWGGSQKNMTYEQMMMIWRREHSEQVASRLKAMGFNFIMIPLYKGGGLKSERTSMVDAKQFSEICHRLGLRVGTYTASGTILYESMLAEDSDARNWFTLDRNGNYVTYGDLYFRRYANRSHPGFRIVMRELVRYAVEEVNVDLIHFDNYVMGPSYEPYSIQQFREYLQNKYSPEERFRRFGFSQVKYVDPPPPPPEPDTYNGDPLYRDFVDYRCEVMSDLFRELADYARSLNPEVVMECNPGGYTGELISSLGIGTVDHARLLQWGGAFWDEGYPSKLKDGLVLSRFRSMMLGRYFNNMVFLYTSDRVAMAESMAYNLQCIGCPARVIGNEITPRLSSHNPKKFDPHVLSSIRFFRREQQYYHDTELIADIGVLNTYANTAYGPAVSRNRWAAVTQALFQGKVPFTLVPDHCAGDLNRFGVLVLADLALISEKLVDAIRRYVQQGGGLVMTGQTAEFDEDNHRRKQTGLTELFPEALGDKILHANPGSGRAVYIPQISIPDKFRIGMLPENRAELLEAVRWAAGGPLQVEVKAPETVTMSLYVQPTGSRILHLVNYDDGNPVSNIGISLQLPAAKRVDSVKLLSPDFEGARTIDFEQSGHTARFTIPELQVYSLVVVD